MLGHLFRLYAMPSVTLGVTGGIGLWALCASYLMVNFALGISKSSREQVRRPAATSARLASTHPVTLFGTPLDASAQVRLLENLRLLRWAAGHGEKDEVGKSGAVVLVAEYIRQHDQPPTILGVEVTPALVDMLNRSVSGVVAAAVASYVTDHLGGHDPAWE